MTPYLTYIKLGAAALLLAIAAGAGFHFGSLSADDKLNAYKTAVEGQHAAQLQAVVNAMTEHDQQAAAQHAADQRVIDAYDAAKAVPDPVAIGLAHRVYLVAASASGAECSQLPAARAVAARTQAPSAIPGGDPSIIGRIQDVIDACTADADQLNAMVKLAP